MLEKAKFHFILLGLGTILCGFSLFSIIKFTDPNQAGAITHASFYLSLFLLCIGVFTLLGVVIRQKFFYGIYMAHLVTSFRQAILLSILLTGSLFLQSLGLALWWVEIIFLLFIMVLEIFFNL
jgi:hypothetical protein